MTIGKKLAPPLPTAITQGMIEAKIKKVTYSQISDTLLTVCVLTMENGYTVLGQNACANPANFNEETGRRYAYDNAIDQAWPLEGYLLKQAMYEANK